VLFVPVQRFEIVAHELFVEGRRAAADTVRVDRPEARRIRRQSFVDERERTGRMDSELEFGVGDDDAALRGRVQRRSDTARARVSRTFAASLDADRPFGDSPKLMFSSCSPTGAFEAGVNDRLGQSARPAADLAASECRTTSPLC
jgi:hypothetical protein